MGIFYLFAKMKIQIIESQQKKIGGFYEKAITCTGCHSNGSSPCRVFGSTGSD